MSSFILKTSVAAAALVGVVALSHAQTGSGGAAGAAPGVGSPAGAQSGAPGAERGKSPAPSTRPSGANPTSNSAQEQAPKGATPPAKGDAASGARTGADTTQNLRTPAPKTGENAAGKEPSNSKGTAESAQSKAAPKSGESAAGKENSGAAKGTASKEGGGAASATNISSEERTKVTSEIRNVNIKEAVNIDVAVNIGSVAPTTIEEYWVPVPTEILRIVPAWRSYRIVKIRGRIFVIEPSSRKIVYVLEG